MNMTGFQCVACSEQQGVDYSGYVCPTCGNNLQVTYDYDAGRVMEVPDWLRSKIEAVEGRPLPEPQVER